MTKVRLSWIIGGLDWERLTDWEERFVESCERYFEKRNDLTDPMENKLEEIYREKMTVGRSTFLDYRRARLGATH